MSQFEYKTDTKEKFTVITILTNELKANLVPEFTNLIQNCGNTSPHNLVINLNKVKYWDPSIIELIAITQGQFYEKNTSFVICALSNPLQDILDKTEYAALLNMTPTESEAWDIVQMEEIERELLDSDDVSFSYAEPE